MNLLHDTPVADERCGICGFVHRSMADDERVVNEALQRHRTHGAAADPDCVICTWLSEAQPRHAPLEDPL